MKNEELRGITKRIIYNDTIYYVVFVDYYGECYGTKNGMHINIYRQDYRYDKNKYEINDENFEENALIYVLRS